MLYIIRCPKCSAFQRHITHHIISSPRQVIMVFTKPFITRHRVTVGGQKKFFKLFSSKCIFVPNIQFLGRFRILSATACDYLKKRGFHMFNANFSKMLFFIFFYFIFLRQRIFCSTFFKSDHLAIRTSLRLRLILKRKKRRHAHFGIL